MFLFHLIFASSCCSSTIHPFIRIGICLLDVSTAIYSSLRSSYLFFRSLFPTVCSSGIADRRFVLQPLKSIHCSQVTHFSCFLLIFFFPILLCFSLLRCLTCLQSHVPPSLSLGSFSITLHKPHVYRFQSACSTSLSSIILNTFRLTIISEGRDGRS